MDKDLKKLITEIVDKLFQSAPMKMVEQGKRKECYDVCPHCKKEIYERHEYTEDAGVTWRHSDCGGLIDAAEEPLDTFVEWLRPAIAEARAQKKEARKSLGINESEDADFDPSNVRKYKPKTLKKTTDTLFTHPSLKHQSVSPEDSVPVGSLEHKIMELKSIYDNNFKTCEEIAKYIEKHYNLYPYFSNLFNSVMNDFAVLASSDPKTIDDYNKCVEVETKLMDTFGKFRKAFYKLSENLPIGGEKKYRKQQPGGTMSAVNIEEDDEWGIELPEDPNVVKKSSGQENNPTKKNKRLDKFIDDFNIDKLKPDIRHWSGTIINYRFFGDKPMNKSITVQEINAIKDPILKKKFIEALEEVGYPLRKVGNDIISLEHEKETERAEKEELKRQEAAREREKKEKVRHVITPEEKQYIENLKMAWNYFILKCPERVSHLSELDKMVEVLIIKNKDTGWNNYVLKFYKEYKDIEELLSLKKNKYV